MAKIWQTAESSKIHPLVEQFCSGEDVGLDQQLVVYDILGSLAHAKMLLSIGLLTKKEQQQIAKGLEQIQKLYHQGKFVVTVADEDVHAAVEAKLIKLIGDAGKKLHTGRSRNDQVLVDLRLYIKDQIKEVEGLAKQLISALKNWGQKYQSIVMPGYTHMQKAMPSSLKMWSTSYADSLTEDLVLLKAALQLADQNPLGSGAGFGVSLPLNKQLTAQLLGFAKVQKNPMACQQWRGKLELAVLSALTQIMITLSKWAQDLLLFTTQEFGFFKVSDAVTTGSSIMPQKKNLDVAELIRAKAHQLIGLQTMVAGMCSGLPSGFNRDMQETKGPLMQGFKTTKDSLAVAEVLMANINPNKVKLKAAMTQDLFATDKAYALVLQGMPFREAYQKVKQEIHESQ